MKINIALLALLVLSFAACNKSKNAKKEPVISNLLISRDTVGDQNPEDTVYMVFNVEDGDGNLRQEDPGIFLKDNWGNNASPFYFPEIPESIVDPELGIVATCTVKVPAPQYFIIRPETPPKPIDSIKFEIYVLDKDSNESNHLETPYIYIVP